MASQLSHFTITLEGENYLLHIEDEQGATMELTATPEQLDLIAEAIEDHLDEDIEDIDEVAEGAE